MEMRSAGSTRSLLIELCTLCHPLRLQCSPSQILFARLLTAGAGFSLSLVWIDAYHLKCTGF
jgi:hypothetical protein